MATPGEIKTLEKELKNIRTELIEMNKQDRKYFETFVNKLESTFEKYNISEDVTGAIVNGFKDSVGKEASRGKKVGHEEGFSDRNFVKQIADAIKEGVKQERGIQGKESKKLDEAFDKFIRTLGGHSRALATTINKEIDKRQTEEYKTLSKKIEELTSTIDKSYKSIADKIGVTSQQSTKRPEKEETDIKGIRSNFTDNKGLLNIFTKMYDALANIAAQSRAQTRILSDLTGIEAQENAMARIQEQEDSLTEGRTTKRKISGGIAGIFGMVGLGAVFTTITAFFAKVKSVFMFIATFAKNVMKTLSGLIKGSETVSKALAPIKTVLGPMARVASKFAIITTVIFAILDFIKGFAQTDGTLLQKAIGGIEGAIQGFIGAFTGLADWILGLLGFETDIKGSVEKIIGYIFDIYKFLANPIEEFKEFIAKPEIQDFFSDVGDKIIQIFELVAKPFTWLKEKVSGALGWLGQKLGISSGTEEKETGDSVRAPITAKRSSEKYEGMSYQQKALHKKADDAHKESAFDRHIMETFGISGFDVKKGMLYYKDGKPILDKEGNHVRDYTTFKQGYKSGKYSIPSRATGGEVNQTGLAQVHTGEMIVPAKVSSQFNMRDFGTIKMFLNELEQLWNDRGFWNTYFKMFIEAKGALEAAGSSAKTDEETDTGATTGSSTPIPPDKKEVDKMKEKIQGEGLLGSWSSQFESGGRGTSAIGFDRTGGASYGKYQIATKTGTMDNFLNYLKKENPEMAEKLLAEKGSMGEKDGAFAKKWKEMAGDISKYEHGFIKKTHYDPAKAGLSDKLKEFMGDDRGLQEALWSTSVQHGSGGASSIWNKVFEKGNFENKEDFINAIYNERGKHFGSSTEAVRESVKNRFSKESALINSMRQKNLKGSDYEQVLAQKNQQEGDAKRREEESRKQAIEAQRSLMASMKGGGNTSVSSMNNVSAQGGGAATMQPSLMEQIPDEIQNFFLLSTIKTFGGLNA